MFNDSIRQQLSERFRTNEKTSMGKVTNQKPTTTTKAATDTPQQHQRGFNKTSLHPK